ncbi:MAG TPA: zinc-ribbon domain containing protein [Dehalococcoidia bacterium]|nr:zinc-ribbon domain containing protein [Dehalococcoidia bacterium]
MSFQEKTLTCQDCGKSFAFTAEEQQFHAEKGYTNLPKRCPDCRRARRDGRSYGGGSSDSSGYGRTRREMYPVTCAQCGAQTEVPFQPRGDRPVYCSDCYSKQASRTRSY